MAGYSRAACIRSAIRSRSGWRISPFLIRRSPFRRDKPRIERIQYVKFVQFVAYLCLRFSRGPAACSRIFVKVLYAVLKNEKVWLGFAGDSNDVFIVILNPASNFFSIDQFDDDGCPALGEAVDIL